MSLEVLVEAAERIRADAAADHLRLAELPIAAIGWATVDHERAMRELDTLFAGDDAEVAPGTWTPFERDPALGAAAWVREVAGSTDAPQLVVLEPDTEGPLAASLVRLAKVWR